MTKSRERDNSLQEIGGQEMRIPEEETIDDMDPPFESH